MKILLTGSSGFIGHHIKQSLEADAAHHLITPSHQQADFNTLTNPESWLPLLKEVDVVINTVGIITETKQKSFRQLHTVAPIALFRACVQSEVKRIIQVSALGADKHAFTPYQISKVIADNVLRDLPLSWFVLRPSLVYGEGGKSLAMFKRLASLPLIPLPDGGNQRIQPVHISDLVATIKQCLNEETSTCQTLDVVGPEAITLAHYIQTIRKTMGKANAAIIPVPAKLILFFAQLGHYLVPLMHPDNLRMLQQGNTADSTPLIAFLGHSPIAAEQALKTMEL